MAITTLNVAPLSTNNAAGTFGTTWAGVIQGQVYPDPAARFALAGGYLAATETIPMWGGVGVYENIPVSAYASTSPLEDYGPTVGRATTLTATSATGLAGFAVNQQAHAWVNTPDNPVPIALSYQTVPFYRLGSGARIAVQIDPGLVNLVGGSPSQQVSWDFTNQVLQAYDASTATFNMSGYTWAATNGGQLVITVGSATPVRGVGDLVAISGLTNGGTGGNGLVTGTFPVTAFTSNASFTVAMPGNSTTIASITGTGVMTFGVGALNVKVLRVIPTNCMVVNWNGTSATWNRNGAAAIIQL